MAHDGASTAYKLHSRRKSDSKDLDLPAAHATGRELLQLAYDRDHLPAGQSQNHLEEAALLAVVQALPPGVHPVALALADRGFARATFLEWLCAHGIDYVVRLNRRTCLTDNTGRRWKSGGDDELACGELRWWPQMLCGLYHEPRELWINAALCWRPPKHQTHWKRRTEPDKPWYLATSLPSGVCPRSPGTDNASGSRSPSRMPIVASASSTSRSAARFTSRASCRPSPSRCAGWHCSP